MMELVQKNMILDGIPFLIYYTNDQRPKSLLFFFHGFSSNKLYGGVGICETLAKKGFFVVGVDAYLHGEREPEFFKNLNYASKQKEIVNIVINTANDAKHLFHKYLKKWFNINQEKVYAYGVSMGSAVTFYLATIMDELKTGICLIGSPSFYDFYQYKKNYYNWEEDDFYLTNLESYKEFDPLLNYQKLNNKNLFMACGDKDTVVPLTYAKKMAGKLINPEVIFKVYDTAHSVTEDMQKDALDYILSH